MSDSKNFDEGMKLRHAMWGTTGAEDRLKLATDFNRPFENMVTEHCFGDIWQRPGLDTKTRSMLTLTALIALNRPNQLKVHVKGAIANGVTVEEIREIIMHTSVYAGIPTGVEAINAAKEVLVSLGLD